MTLERLITENFDIWTAAVAYHNGSNRAKNSEVDFVGIDKLRELILELAVRGKLVPQDPEEKPAARLLEELPRSNPASSKRAQSKDLNDYNGDDVAAAAFELPPGWEWTRISRIAEISPRNQAADDTEVGFVPMPMVGTGHDGRHGFEVSRWGNVKKGYTHFADGDIALAKITPCFENSKAAVIQGLPNGVGAGTTELHVARPCAPSINPYFVLLYLKSPEFLARGKQVMTGSAGQKRVPKTYFSDTPCPLPPATEQARIVEKVDELMALCDRLEQQTRDQISAHETLVDTLLDTLTRPQEATALAGNWGRLTEDFDTLFTTEQSIERLVQSILQLAVMGRLVRQDPNEEPASKRLERIAAEKERLCQEGTIRKSAKLPEITEEEKPFELPEGWEWARLEELTSYIQRGKSPKYAEQGTVKVVSQKCVQWRGFLAGPSKWVSDDSLTTYQPERFLRQGDVLWNSTGTGTVGRVVSLDKSPDPPMVADSHVTVLRFVGVPPDFSLIFLKSRFVQDRIDPEHSAPLVSGTTKQVELNTSQVRNLPVPVPPVDEQTRIVERVGKFISLCDRLRAQLGVVRDTQRQLAESLVRGTGAEAAGRKAGLGTTVDRYGSRG